VTVRRERARKLQLIERHIPAIAQKVRDGELQIDMALRQVASELIHKEKAVSKGTALTLSPRGSLPSCLLHSGTAKSAFEALAGCGKSRFTRRAECDSVHSTDSFRAGAAMRGEEPQTVDLAAQREAFQVYEEQILLLVIGEALIERYGQKALAKFHRAFAETALRGAGGYGKTTLQQGESRHKAR
jgi:hypothetical protein